MSGGATHVNQENEAQNEEGPERQYGIAQITGEFIDESKQKRAQNDAHLAAYVEECKVARVVHRRRQQFAVRAAAQ